MSQRHTNHFHIARQTDQPEPMAGWRLALNDIIFGAESVPGKGFDIALIIAILMSVGAVMLETVGVVQAEHGRALVRLEWFFTLAFTIEYGLRLVCVRHPWRYATSFFGIVDLLSIIPTYLSLLIPGVNSLLVIRVLRILRVFRVLKLFRYLSEAEMLLQAMRTGYRKILVFLYASCI